MRWHVAERCELPNDSRGKRANGRLRFAISNAPNDSMLSTSKWHWFDVDSIIISHWALVQFGLMLLLCSFPDNKMPSKWCHGARTSCGLYTRISSHRYAFSYETHARTHATLRVRIIWGRVSLSDPYVKLTWLTRTNESHIACISLARVLLV